MDEVVMSISLGFHARRLSPPPPPLPPFHPPSEPTICHPSAIQGDYFTAVGITFQNTAGVSGLQAVALRINADLAAFYGCSMEGFQVRRRARRAGGQAGRQEGRDIDMEGDRLAGRA